MQLPGDSLRVLAEQLREERSVIAPHVVEPDGAEPALGALAAAGPRAAGAPGEYAVVVEAVREGYLLHYGEARLLAGADLYALGLQRLGALGDLAAVRELSDLISISAQLEAEGRAADAAEALWLGCTVAIGCGASPAHEGAKAGLREGRSEAPAAMLAAAREAAEADAAEALAAAAAALDLTLR